MSSPQQLSQSQTQVSVNVPVPVYPTRSRVSIPNTIEETYVDAETNMISISLF
jgi:hypothetical protein